MDHEFGELFPALASTFLFRGVFAGKGKNSLCGFMSLTLKQRLFGVGLSDLFGQRGWVWSASRFETARDHPSRRARGLRDIFRHHHV